MNNNTTETRKDFDSVKRTFENALAGGGDYAAELYELATAIAYSVVNKCIDPQRKTAAEKDSASDNGCNPLMVELKQGIGQDRRTLDSTRRNANAATRTTFNNDGNAVTVTADTDAAAALAALLGESITDGFDVVQEAAAAILEQAADHAKKVDKTADNWTVENVENWLDVPYTVRRLSKRVYIRMEDSAAYRDETTTPIQEVYKAVRRYIQNSRAMRTDPRNGYSYLEEVAPDGLETIYFRLGKYADLGGYAQGGHFGQPGRGDRATGLYTVDRQTVDDAAAIVEKLDLTDRQAQVLKLRMQGKGYKAIATYLGVTQRAIAKTVERIQEKATAAGLTA